MITPKQRTLTMLHAVGAYRRCPLCGSRLYESWQHDCCTSAGCSFGKLDGRR